MKKKILGIMVSLIAGVTFMAHGQATLPYSCDFEGYTAGSSVTNADWTASSAVTTVITNITYLNTVAMNTPYMGSPIEGGAHAQVLSFDTGSSSLTNSYSDANAHVIIDTMIQPALAPELIYSDAITQSQFSVSFLTNGVAIWHGIQTNLPPVFGADYAMWSVLNYSATAIQPGKWVRLTVALNYQALPGNPSDGSNAMFQVKLDGQPLTSALGHATPNMQDATTGSWHLMAWKYPPSNISKTILSGTGLMDDLTLTASSDSPTYITQNHGIPYNWFTYMGVVTNGSSSNSMATAAIDTADFDGDGMPNWQEYFAGTEPTNALSKLVIISQSVDTSGKATIKWLNAAHPLANYSIAMATNLEYSTTWQSISNNIASEAGGTNTLTASGPTNTPAFFRVLVPVIR